MNKYCLFALLILITVICASGCTGNDEDLAEDASGNKNITSEIISENTPMENTGTGDDVLYQISTMDALLQSVYDGVLSYNELETHGDFGIGTFDGLEGEMLALDGEYYQIKSDGIVYPVSGNMTTPFATVTTFEPDEKFWLEGPMNITDFEQYLDSKLPSENLFYAVRVDGNFSYLKARSIPKQEKPYPRLVDSASTQVVFEFENISGTLVGFRTPEYVKGINVPGYHIHFISRDRTAGGHVLDFELENGNASIDVTTAFFMELPESGDFYSVELGRDLQAEVESVEK
jgi:acetolactate decarboxylase